MDKFLKDLENIMDEVSPQSEYTILDSDISSLVAMSIKDIPAFKALKSLLLIRLLKPEVLDRNNLVCIDIPELVKKPHKDLKYYYIFDKSTSISKKELEDLVFSAETVLGVYPSNNNIMAKEERKKLLKYANRGIVTLDEKDLNKVLTSVKLSKIKLLIRISNHDREDLSRDLYEAEHYKEVAVDPYEQEDAQYQYDLAKDKISRFDARASIVDKKRIYNVDERSAIKIVQGIPFERYGATRILEDFRECLTELNKEIGGSIYKDSDLKDLINEVFDDRYEKALKDARDRGKRR